MIRAMVIVFFFNLICAPSYAQGTASNCREIASQLNEHLGKMGQFPANDSELPKFERQKGKWLLNTDGLSREKIEIIRSASATVAMVRLQHPDSAKCVFDRLGEDVMLWWNFFNSHLTGNTELPSPNFYKATYVTLNLRPLGVIRPFIEGEGYSSSYDLLIGRTIKRRNPGKDRVIRLNAGAKYMHQYENGEWLGLAAVDCKLTDVKIAGLFNIGLLKLQFQGYGNKDVMGLEGGLGFETYGLGIQLLSVGYQEYFETRGMYFQSGFSIMPFALRKFFKK